MMRASLSVLGCVSLLACGRTPAGPFGNSSRTGTDDGTGPSDTRADQTGPGRTETSFVGSSSTGEPNCIDAPELCVVDVTLRRAVDILFVVDNSGSMGGEQGTLARSFASFINVLETQEVGANYRIGVTTSAGDGGLRATSCRSRLQEFIFSWQFGDIDERQRGCLNECGLETIGLAQPWVEKSNGTTNLPPGVDMAAALQCIGPQGINGPGFEAPLEAMRNAVLDEGAGFLRPDALLAVIFVTDEADCSAPPENIDWIQTQGQVFWTDPERSTSGVCWAAGVECLGGPGVYDDCIPVDLARSGLPTSEPDEAVLYPVDRYVDVLTELAEQKQLEGGQGEVFVAVLGGVPLDYPQTGEALYADSIFSEFNTEYGIGPGCGGGAESINDPPGIPPVRLREFAEAFASEQRNLFSICSDDYGVALTDIADSIGAITERACVNGCVVDVNPALAGLQPSCEVVERFADGQPELAVPPCIVGQGAWEFPSADVNACHRPLTDPSGATTTPFDDMSPQCVTVGSNLEFVVERREDAPVAAGTSVQVTCNLEAPLGTACEDV